MARTGTPPKRCSTRHLRTGVPRWRACRVAIIGDSRPQPRGAFHVPPAGEVRRRDDALRPASLLPVGTGATGTGACGLPRTSESHPRGGRHHGCCAYSLSASTKRHPRGAKYFRFYDCGGAPGPAKPDANRDASGPIKPGARALLRGGGLPALRILNQVENGIAVASVLEKVIG